MSNPPQRLVAGLDLGSTKAVALIAEVTGDPRDAGCRILGVGVERSAGIRRGVVRDIEETTRAIDKAMKSAQRMAGVQVGSVYCGIAGEHVAGRSSHGMVSVTGDEIRTSDVARVNDMASNISFGRDHELLHAIPQDYLIDQQGGINEPIGMTGSHRCPGPEPARVGGQRRISTNGSARRTGPLRRQAGRDERRFRHRHPQVTGSGESARSGEAVAPGLLLSRAGGTNYAF